MEKERLKTGLSSNPMLNDDRFSAEAAYLETEPMTIQGTVNKLFLLFACLIAGAAIGVYNLFSNPSTVSSMLWAGSIIGFLLVLATCFNIKLAKFTAAPYALCEGLVLGGISAMFETQFQGIVLQAIAGTLTVFVVMLLLYKAKMICYTEKFQAVLKTALLSVLAVYLIQLVAMFFGRSIPYIWQAGPIGIIFSLVVIVIAAMSLIQDFFFIENASENMLSKDYEWYGAMGLMVTLVWLYLEILRLLAKLNSRK